MGSLKEIRTRIKVVKNTQKITKAMKLVAASKLRRAQEAIVAARPYTIQLKGILTRVASVLEEVDAQHPLLQSRTPKRVLVLPITSDRGLCGAFNANVIRKAHQCIKEHVQSAVDVELLTIGRRGADHFRKTPYEMREWPEAFTQLNFRTASDIAESLASAYINGQVDAVYVIYSEFKSAISQEVHVETLLPIVKDAAVSADAPDYIYEPDPAAVLASLLPRYVATQIWRALLESYASEHGARMTAMDSATRNAVELVDDLTLIYNRARQASITQGIMEIVGGAEALSG